MATSCLRFSLFTSVLRQQAQHIRTNRGFHHTTDTTTQTNAAIQKRMLQGIQLVFLLSNEIYLVMELVTDIKTHPVIGLEQTVSTFRRVFRLGKSIRKCNSYR